MKAILLCEANRATILLEPSTLNPHELDRMIEEYGDKTPALYFVPKYNVAWATIPQEYLDHYFTYDSDKIKTEFVELHGKANVQSIVPSE